MKHTLFTYRSLGLLSHLIIVAWCEVFLYYHCTHQSPVSLSLKCWFHSNSERGKQTNSFRVSSQLLTGIAKLYSELGMRHTLPTPNKLYTVFSWNCTKVIPITTIQKHLAATLLFWTQNLRVSVKTGFSNRPIYVVNTATISRYNMSLESARALR